MRPVSDEFLLNMAEVSASLIGLFLVGVFFYLETGRRRLHDTRQVFEPYLRAGIRITMIVFAIPLGLSLTLVTLEPIWSRFLFLLLSLMLVAANVSTAVRIPMVWRVTRSTALLLMEVVTSIGVVMLVTLPWVLGGIRPTREDLTWAILLAFAAGFLSIAATVMSAFDFAQASFDESESDVALAKDRLSADLDNGQATEAGADKAGDGELVKPEGS